MLEPLFRQISRCLTSSHFQVAERSLFLWNNEYIVQLVAAHRAAVLPMVLGALEQNAANHWNPAVHRWEGGAGVGRATLWSPARGQCGRLGRRMDGCGSFGSVNEPLHPGHPAYMALGSVKGGRGAARGREGWLVCEWGTY